jgi:hypothetical protein
VPVQIRLRIWSLRQSSICCRDIHSSRYIQPGNLSTCGNLWRIASTGNFKRRNPRICLKYHERVPSSRLWSLVLNDIPDAIETLDLCMDGLPITSIHYWSRWILRPPYHKMQCTEWEHDHWAMNYAQSPSTLSWPKAGSGPAVMYIPSSPPIPPEIGLLCLYLNICLQFWLYWFSFIQLSHCCQLRLHCRCCPSFGH